MVLQWKIFGLFIAIWSILWPFDIFYCHLVDFAAIWYIFPSFSMLHQGKSGNPGRQSKQWLSNIVGNSLGAGSKLRKSSFFCYKLFFHKNSPESIL
jgi:hypothetical protein